MIIEQGKFFQYSFLISFGDDDDKDTKKISKIFAWCNENINGQWMSINHSSYSSNMIGVSYFSKATHKSPLTNYEYPPAEIQLTMDKIFIFEDEDDAAAFKIMWI